MTYNVLKIIRGTTVDGPGFRTSIYLAGCGQHCPGCQNPQSWNPDGGDLMTIDQILDIVEEEDFDVTLSGGDPLYNAESTLELCKAIKERYGKNIWLYTGYTIEQIEAESRLKAVTEWVDAIVEGPFIESLKDPDLLFRGSSNQRIIHFDGKDRT